MNTNRKGAAATIAAALATTLTLAISPAAASAAPSCQELGDDLLIRMDKPGQTVGLSITGVDINVTNGSGPGAERLGCSAVTFQVDKIVVRDETKKGSTNVVLDDGTQFSDNEVTVETDLGAGRDDTVRVEGDGEMDAFLVHGRSILALGTIAVTGGADVIELRGDGGQDTLGAYSQLVDDPAEAEAVAARTRIEAIGGAGPDYLLAGAKADRLVGGASRDLLVARDGNRDSRIDCGAGKDWFTSDRKTDPKAKGCEIRSMPSDEVRAAGKELAL